MKYDGNIEEYTPLTCFIKIPHPLFFQKLQQSETRSCGTCHLKYEWANTEGRGVHKVFVGKPEGKRPLGRPRRRWEDNIRMDFEEVGRGCGDWMELAQDRDRWRALVSTVMNRRVP